MTTLLIPTSTTESQYSQTTTLEGRDYELTFSWFERGDRWYLDIASDGVTLLAGLKIVADWPLLRLRTSELLPPGELIALDMTGNGRDPNLRDLGERVKLFYIESEDLEALGLAR